MDATAGVFTTFKLQSLLDCGANDEVRSRRDLVAALVRSGHDITIHGVEAWFRHVDSNYNLPRDSLSGTHRSYAIPRRRWKTLGEIFRIGLSALDEPDEAFRRSCFARSVVRDEMLPTPAELVGRTEELADIAAAYERCAGGSPEPIGLVEGAAGVGKSALLDAAAFAFRERGALVLRCSCAEHADTPLLPAMELLETHREVIRSVDETAQATLDRLLATAHSEDGGDVLFVAVAATLSRLARHRTVVFVLDDAHWADESTAQLVAQLARHRAAGSQGLFVLVAARPQRDGDWPSGFRKAVRKATVLSLGALDRVQSSNLVRTRLGTSCSEAFLDWIWAQTLGNPFYMEQVLAHLRRNGALDSSRVPPTEVDVPRSIVATVSAGFQRLSGPTRELLAMASVFGGAFSVAELQYALEGSTTQTVVDGLEEAEHAGLVVYSRDRFRFSHPLTRQTVYEQLAESRRAYLHFALSQRLIHSDSARPLALLEVAGHLLRGRMFADGAILARACAQASKAAQMLEAWDQVVRHAKAALDVRDEGALVGEERLELERLAGLGLHQTGNPREAIHYHQRVVEAHTQSGDIVEAVRALTNVCRIRANYAISSTRQPRDIDTLVDALPTLRESDPRLTAWVLDTIAVEYFTEDRERAEACIDEALALLKSGPPCWEHANVLAEAGLLSLARADPVTACQHFVHGGDVARAAGDKGAIARSLQRLAVAQLALGRLDELHATAQSIELLDDDATETGEHTVVLAAQLSALVLRGQTDAAERTYVEATDLLERTGYRGAVDMVHGAYAAGLAGAGRYDEAQTVVDDAARWQLPQLGAGAARPFTTLRRRLGLLIADLEAPQPGRPIPEDLLLRPPRGTRYLGSIATFAVGLEIAIRRGHAEQMRLAMPVVAEACRRGTVVTAVWPLVAPLLLARAAIALGQSDMARIYMPIGHDHALRMAAPRPREEAEAIATRLGLSLPSTDRLSAPP